MVVILPALLFIVDADFIGARHRRAGDVISNVAFDIT